MSLLATPLLWTAGILLHLVWYKWLFFKELVFLGIIPWCHSMSAWHQGTARIGNYTCTVLTLGEGSRSRGKGSVGKGRGREVSKAR